MKRHMKRQSMPKIWPIARKGTTFVIKGTERIIPVLIILRDILKVAQNRKEVKHAIHEKKILVCGKILKNEKKGLALYDTITIVPSKESYRLTINDKGKFDLEKINEKESHEKIVKIINKKILKGKKIQVNFSDGRNMLYAGKFELSDSAIISFLKKEIIKIIPLKEKANVLVTSGKYTGTIGVIEKIDRDKKMAEIKSKENKFNALIKQIMVID